MLAPSHVSRQRAAAAAAATGRQANAQCGCRINNTPRSANQTRPHLWGEKYHSGLIGPLCVLFCEERAHGVFSCGDNTHLKSKHLSLVCRGKTRGASGASEARANDAVETST